MHPLFMLGVEMDQPTARTNGKVNLLPKQFLSAVFYYKLCKKEVCLLRPYALRTGAIWIAYIAINAMIQIMRCL